MCDTKPCINPNCIDGWDTGRPAPAAFPRGRDAYLRVCLRLRCCTACGGRGYLADERDNRRHYYSMRAIAGELENGRPDDWDLPATIPGLDYPTIDLSAVSTATAFEDLAVGARR